MPGQQELTTKSLLKDAFQGSVSAERQRTNQLASKSMARFTLLMLCAIAVLLMKCWL